MTDYNCMTEVLKNKLIRIAKSKITDDDPSHDIHHALRVVGYVELLSKEEGADLDILIPAALFHDIVNYPKNDPMSLKSSTESAVIVGKILSQISEYPQNKIKFVQRAIQNCSFRKGVKHIYLESKILQDADALEATGAIAIMRTFASAGQMKKTFYSPHDPYCKKREPNSKDYALDLFFDRLFKVRDRMYTQSARKLACLYTKFLTDFMRELKFELKTSLNLKEE